MGMGGVRKTPKDSSASGTASGSTIKQYMNRGGSPGNPRLETQKSTLTEKKMGGTGKVAQTPEHSRQDSSVDSILDNTRMEEGSQDMQPPSKNEIIEMFKSLELAIKTEINVLRMDLGGILARVEKTEDILDKQELDLSEIKEQLKIIHQNQIKICYRLEDQENRNRRQNLRIRGVPERKDEDLKKIMVDIFGPILELGGGEFPKIERIHRIGRRDTSRTERSRDIIVKFRYFVDKDNLWAKLRGRTPLLYEDARISVYPDLARDTLTRRRHLKPLLDLLKEQNIKYTWGFPACLIGSREGKTAKLRFPGDLEKFCGKLEIQAPPLPDWASEKWVDLGIGYI